MKYYSTKFPFEYFDKDSQQSLALVTFLCILSSTCRSNPIRVGLLLLMGRRREWVVGPAPVCPDAANNAT